eukprot:1195135-Prorocentrum_minimum.AAC.1
MSFLFVVTFWLQYAGSEKFGFGRDFPLSPPEVLEFVRQKSTSTCQSSPGLVLSLSLTWSSCALGDNTAQEVSSVSRPVVKSSSTRCSNGPPRPAGLAVGSVPNPSLFLE